MKPLIVLIANFAIACILVACGGEGSQTTAGNGKQEQTGEVVQTPEQVSTSEPVVAAAQLTQEVDGPDQAAEVVQTPVVAGDVEKGSEIYANVDFSRCSWCHSLDGSEIRGGPTFLGISERAGMRVPELSAEEYLRQSIIEPSAYIVEGYEKVMDAYELVERPEGDYKKPFTLTEAELDYLVAFLLTQ